MHDFPGSRGDGPPCLKCNQPTKFDSVQIVRRGDREDMMFIFCCERCQLLSAECGAPEKVA